MKNRRKDNKPTEDPEDVTSWELPSQVEADGLAPKGSSNFFEPPAGLPPTLPTPESPAVPPTAPPSVPPSMPPAPPALPPLDTELPSPPPPSLPPPPPAPDKPAMNEPTADSWVEAAPSAEVRDFPAGASTASPFRPDLPIPGAVIDLTSRTEHPYDDIYTLGSDETDVVESSRTDSETIDLAERLDLTSSRTPASPEHGGPTGESDSVRELPQDLRSALQIATTPALGLPHLDENDELAEEPSRIAPVSALPAPPTAQASAMAQTPSILTVDVLGTEPPNLSGLFTDVLTDNGFDVNSVNETSILLTRDAGTVTIDRADASDGCIVEVDGLPATAVKKLMLAGLLQIGYEIQASRTNETVLRNQSKSLARIVHI